MPIMEQIISENVGAMVAKLDDEIREALDQHLVRWTFADVRRRCTMVKVPSVEFETLYCDGVPLLDIYPIEIEPPRQDGDRLIMRCTRKVRRHSQKSRMSAT